MSTAGQINANSKMNALKHGLTAAEIVIKGEDPEQFRALDRPATRSCRE